jgi:ribosome maturation protein Sdo1
MPAKGHSKLSGSPEIIEKINRLYKEGKGPRQISRALQEGGFKISHMSIQRYLESVHDRKEIVMQQDAQLTEYVKNTVFDTAEQLRNANKMLWQMLEEAKVSKSFKLQVIKQITNTIKLADDLMNQFKGVHIDARGASKVQLVQTVINQLNEMEARGDIVIKNPKLRQPEISKVIDVTIGKEEEKEVDEDGEGKAPEETKAGNQ